MTEFLYFDNLDVGSGSGPESKGRKDSADSLNLLDATASGESKKGRNEIYPVGLFNAAPASDDPVYYKSGTADDGKTVTVGPFGLTGKNLREWADNTSSEQLDELVNRRAIRTSTAMAVKSNLFDTVVDMLTHGQKPSEATIRRILPADLQRVVETSRRGM